MINVYDDLFDPILTEDMPNLVDDLKKVASSMGFNKLTTIKYSETPNATNTPEILSNLYKPGTSIMIPIYNEDLSSDSTPSTSLKTKGNISYLIITPKNEQLPASTTTTTITDLNKTLNENGDLTRTRLITFKLFRNSLDPHPIEIDIDAIMFYGIINVSGKYDTILRISDLCIFYLYQGILEIMKNRVNGLVIVPNKNNTLVESTMIKSYITNNDLYKAQNGLGKLVSTNVLYCHTSNIWYLLEKSPVSV